jgi:tRNA (mo5U34)-methyltransferase
MSDRVLDGDFLLDEAKKFRSEINQIKGESRDFQWYPYDSLSNFNHLKDFFNSRPLNMLAKPGSEILDIGAADGEVAFLLERLGYKPNILDYGPTNHNNLKGARILSKKLNSEVQIFDFDLDSYGSVETILTNSISLTFLLGIHYHLKNPFLILDFLSKKTEYLFFSTRIARYSVQGYEMKNESLSYLLGPAELNNDATNYWVFSEKALLLLFERTGYEVIIQKNVGDLRHSVPNDMKHDERFFALLKSKNYVSAV